MSYLFIKLLSISIFIAEEQNHHILSILLEDYARKLLSLSQFILIKLLLISYKKKNIFKEDIYYKIIDEYIYKNSNHLCKVLLRTVKIIIFRIYYMTCANILPMLIMAFIICMYLNFHTIKY